MDIEKSKHLPANTSTILGSFEGRVHLYQLHIFYEDTDFSGVVYHANYLRFFERARSSFLNLLGIRHADLWEQYKLAFTIRSITLDYLKSAQVDDLLTIKTTYNQIKGARLFITQECYRGDDLLVSAKCEAACIASNGRPTRAPTFLKERLKDFLSH